MKAASALARKKAFIYFGRMRITYHHWLAFVRVLALGAVFLMNPGCRNETGWKLAPGIYILDKDSPVESYDELLERLPRNPYYVDCWATWCAPCVEEFAYYDSIRDFFKEHGIGILYLNSDMGIDEKVWHTFIRDHQLRGYHVRLTQQLQRDLIDRRVYNPRIPQFMVMDSNGLILEKNALRPSDGEKLIQQLNRLLDQ